MNVKGKVVSILEVVTGEGKNGLWTKGGYVIETLDDKYPKKIAIDLFNDNLDNIPSVGEVVTSHLNIESREFNSKWYTNVGAWKIDKEGVQDVAPSNQSPDEDEQKLPF